MPMSALPGHLFAPSTAVVSGTKQSEHSKSTRARLTSLVAHTICSDGDWFHCIVPAPVVLLLLLLLPLLLLLSLLLLLLLPLLLLLLLLLLVCCCCCCCCLFPPSHFDNSFSHESFDVCVHDSLLMSFHVVVNSGGLQYPLAGRPPYRDAPFVPLRGAA
ncbi:unnamed protein product [Polarella glacialis]|uniref:Uncharacterized protein n=1 Tax=Polarella glacialis TaxID=89957 RepID=A0A813JY27_POLGL|nr:unnamed protein product [Polarella glacialis]